MAAVALVDLPTGGNVVDDHLVVRAAEHCLPVLADHLDPSVGSLRDSDPFRDIFSMRASSRRFASSSFSSASIRPVMSMKSLGHGGEQGLVTFLALPAVIARLWMSLHI